MHKPEGHNAVSPYLIVTDAQRALDFVQAVFGGEPGFVARREDGAIGHAEIRIEDSVVMIGQSDRAVECHVHVYVPDPDAAFARATIAGAGIVQELSEAGDGDRRGGVKDTTGTTWWIAAFADPQARDRAGSAG